ncbi:phage tail tape measure protein [Sulfitobacter sp. OXR-159]|uniref:phage tail tape measure protein n=1 Tax=Sulfitobacter sp. OXR-159 TaxID=3100174 RepID=UPI002AC8FD38|nr:phage tail tape measure protein [Sulfitobacter sp. OXR-159]WPZ28200.1 phage tail tape measure protein [Sulfitobacter sp. OXR-159]
MATKRIETLLSIKAIDQYSNTLRNMRTATGRFADGVRTELSSLQGIRGPLRLIEDFRKQQDVVRKSGAAMEQAREKQRRLLAEIRATNNPTAQMRREFDRARTAADRLEQQHHQNRRTLSGLRGQMRSADINTADLAGEQRRLAGSVDRVTTSIGNQIDRLRRLETMQTRIAEGRERMDRSLATASNVAITGFASIHSGKRILTALSGPVQQAVEFESAMSDVRKVVDFDTPEAFSEMSEDILELSTRIPMAADGLAQIVAAGGQSGIARDELLKFTEMAAKVGVAFDISADHAGSSMADIKTAMRLTLDETGSLFDAMNHLSNNSNARADKTLDFMNRAGASGATFGFDNTETLAIGASMIAAGAGADTAATSFRNMGRSLTRGASATKRQSGAMRILGLDAEQVARGMQRDAVATTSDVLQRLRELPEHMQASVMSDLFGDEARELTKLINNAELLPQLLSLVAEERQYLGSSEAEYAERAKTTANNLQLMRNQMSRLGISIGEVVLPPLNDLLEMSQGVIERLVEWTKENPKLTKGLVIGATAFGALAVAGGAVLTVAGGLIGTMAVLRFGLVGLGARAVFAGGEVATLASSIVRAGRSGSGLARLSTGLTAFTTSRAGAMRAVSGALRGFAGITGLRVVATALTGLVGVVGTISAPVWAAVAAAVATVGAAWKYWDRISSIVSGVASAIGDRLQPVLESIKPVLEFLSPVVDGVKTAFSGIGDVISDVVSAIREFFSGDLFSREVLTDEEKSRLENSASEMTDKIIDGIASGVSGVFQVGRDIIVSLWDGARAEFAEFIEWVKDMPARIVESIGVIEMSDVFNWGGPPSWWTSIFGGDEAEIAAPTIIDAPNFSQLPEAQQSAAETVVSVAQAGPLPTPRRLQDLREHSISLREEITRIQGEIDDLGQGPMADSMAASLRQAMGVRSRELREVEAELSNAEVRADELSAALKVIHGTDAAPEISTASIERADGLISEMLAKLQAAPLSEVVELDSFRMLPPAPRAAAETVVSITQSGPLPTPARLQELRDHAASLREEIANIQGEIDNLGQGPMADTMAIPLRQDMDARRRELQEVETELSSAEKRADDLTSALQVLDGTEAAPEISTASIDRANEKVARLLAQLRSIPSAGTGAVASPKPAGARALGGPVRTGLPYLVNENTPRSEWFVPSQSGGILNVSQAQSALRAHMTSMSFRPIPTNPSLTRLHRGAQGLRAASLAVLTSSAVAMPAAAQSAPPVKPGSSSVTVQIENFTVQVPSGVSDPEAIADLVSERIGQRVSATLTASFSD